MSDTKAPSEVVVLTVNGKAIEARAGELVIEAAAVSYTHLTLPTKRIV